jgi:outer membrane immunogenic protein
MKKTILAAAAATALFAVPAIAQAQAQVYGNIGYASVAVEDADVTLGLIQGRLGIQMTPNFAIEGEAGFGISDDTIAGVDIEMKYEVGAYIVGKAPISENFDIFARLGYVSYEVEASAGGVTATDSGSDAAYGVGVQGFFTPNDGIRADWTSYAGDADVWSISYVRRF